MNAMRKPTLQKSSTGSRRPLLTGTLAFCSALALNFSNAAFAEEANIVEDNSSISREEIQGFIDSTVLGTPDTQIQSSNDASIISQIGSDNTARVNQSRRAGYAQGNLAIIYQNGNHNEANIIQSGGDNIGLINQIGNDHQATIKQDSNGQAFDTQVHQSGANSNIHVSQSGSGYRSISVSQRASSGTTAPVTIRTY